MFPHANERAFLNEVQAAEILNIKVSTLRKWRQLSRGPRFVKIGTKSVRYSSRDLRQWLESSPTGGGQYDRVA